MICNILYSLNISITNPPQNYMIMCYFMQDEHRYWLKFMNL
jgi:hypothetical protein